MKDNSESNPTLTPADKRQNKLKSIDGQYFDLIVIGGGIVGTSMAREATLAGKKVLLLEKNDFGHGTSSVTSKLLHGGLRYLKNLEFGLVRNSLRERSGWSVLSPHLVKPRALVMPFYGWGTKGPLYLLLGLILYQLLRIGTGAGHIKVKGFRLFRNATIRRLFPFLKSKKLNGGAAYYDLALRSPERMVVDMLLDATGGGAVAMNYCEVERALFERSLRDSGGKTAKQIKGVVFTDTLSGQSYECYAETLVTATGPWPLSKLLKDGKDQEPEAQITSSSGIHLVIPQRLVSYGLVQPVDGDHIFLLPWGNRTLLGTTDVPYQGNPDDYQVGDGEIKGLLQKAEQVWPDLLPKLRQYYYTYGGIRPITAAGTEAGDVYNSSRDHLIAGASMHGVAGLYLLTGGKYTTARLMAAECMQKISKDAYPKTKWPKHKSRRIPLLNAILPEGVDAAVRAQDAAGLYEDPAIYRRLYEHYGRYAESILTIAGFSPLHRRTYLDGELTVAELIYAFENEGALNLDDALLRRTNAGVRCIIDKELRATIDEDLQLLCPAYKAASSGTLATAFATIKGSD